jgi:hypothetical protein
MVLLDECLDGRQYQNRDDDLRRKREMQVLPQHIRRPDNLLVILVSFTVAFYYITGANNRDYYQMCPMIATYPVIPNDAPVWDALRNGGQTSLIPLFSSGLASQNDQSQDGSSLLHVGSTILEVLHSLMID